MSFRLESGNLELFGKVGVSKQESELLSHINEAVRSITSKIQEGDTQIKIRNCKELLQLIAAIRQDVLGDFPSALLTLNLELWDLLINSLSSCCCPSVSDKTYKALFPSLYENSSTDGYMGSSCCVVLKEKILELLAEMIQSINELLNKKKKYFTHVSEVELWALNLAETVIPNLVCSSLKSSVSSHCECKLEPLLSISFVVQETISTYSEHLMKESRLWSTLFRLLMSCNDLNSYVIVIKEKILSKQAKSELQVVDFSVNNLRFLDSAQLICSTFTRFNFLSENEGHKYFSLLAAGDIFSQFIKYVSTIFKIVYFGNAKICNSKLDFLFNQQFDLRIESYAEYSDEVESSKKMTEFDDLDGSENIEDIYNFDIELNSINIRNNSCRSALENIQESEINQSQQKESFETNSLMSCIVFLLGNEKIIEFDSFKITNSDSIRFTILDVLESLFQTNDLASLDSVTMISQTLFVYDFISLLYPNASNYSLDNQMEYKFSYIEKLTERFIKSPIHVVASIIYILRSDASKENLSKHLSTLLDCLFSLKNSPFENLIPITLGYLFDLLCQESHGSKNLTSLFDVLIERASDECLHVYSPLAWISKAITLEFVLNQNEKALLNSSKIISGLRSFLSKWVQVSELMLSSPAIHSCQSRLRGVRRCILYCSLSLKGVRDNLETENLTDLYMVSMMLTLVVKNRSLRRTCTLQLIDLLNKRANFPKDDLNLEVIINNLDFIERQWNLNTKHVFSNYFTLLDLEKDEINNIYEPQIYEEILPMSQNEELGGENQKPIIMGMEGSNLSVLKTPDSFRLSKLLTAIKNPRIQTQIKISALKSLTESLTSSKISFKVFCLYVDELVKILMQLSCKSFCTKKQNLDNSSKDDSVFGISELISIEEGSLFYHLSVALNAIFISRSYRKDLLEYLAASYSIMLIHHLSFWIFSSSGECRCSSFSLLTTILIIILKTGVISDAPSIEFSDDLYLDKTITYLKISPLVQNMLILPTSTRETKEYKEIYEEELHEKSEHTSPPKFDNIKKTNPFKPLVSQTTISQGISKILWDLERLFRKRSIQTNVPYLEEFLYSVFSLSFPWTRMTSQAVHLERGISKIKDSIDSVLSKLIMSLGQNNPEYLSEIERYSDLINAQSRNIDIKMLAVLKVIHSILYSFQLVNNESLSESLSKYSSFIIVILSYFNNYLRDKDCDFLVGTIRPKISFGIFDTISLCLDSCNGALSELLFDILPNNIQWSFIVLQVPKLIDPLNLVHSPTAMLLVTRLLSRMPLKRWFEEDPRYTLECLKLLIFNKSLFCNRELPESLLSVQSFQDSYFVKKVISIFEKISVLENPNHPINILLQKNLLKWLLGAGLVSSSLEVQAKIWDLKLILLDKWDVEYSNDTYSIISNFKVPNVENDEIAQQVSWGFIFSRSIKSLNHLISNISYLEPITDNLIKSFIGWRSMEFFEYLTSILRFLEVFLSIQHRPIQTESNENLDQASGEIQLLVTTFIESMEVIAEEVITPFLQLITAHDSGTERERLLFTNLMFGFLCKLSRFLPLSSPVFQKFAENLCLFSASLSGLSQLELSINSSLLQIQLVLCIIKTDSSCYGVLREHLIILISNISPKEMSSEQMSKLLSFLLTLFDKRLKNHEICPRLLEKMSLLCNEVLLRISEISPKTKEEQSLTLEMPSSLNFNNTCYLLMGVSLLSLKLSQIASVGSSSNSLDQELRGEIFNLVMAGIEVSSKISISSEFLTLYSYLDQINTLQESLALFLSALSNFNSSDLYINIENKFTKKLFNYAFTIWESFIYLVSFYSKNQMNYSEELYHEPQTQVNKKKEFYKEIKLYIDYYTQIITIDIFTELITNNLDFFTPGKFTEDLKNIWLFINSEENGSKLNYSLVYFSSFLYKIKIRSSGSLNLGDWNRRFNKNFYRIGLLDYILLRTSEILVEVREICLGELRSCTIASLRAMAKQKNTNLSKLNENVFLSQMCSLFQLVKMIGLFLAEFEGPHNLLTNNKLKPLLSFTLESLALLSCVSKQLEAELERNNHSSFESCIRAWWKYTCKVTGESQDIEHFSYMITQIISLLLCCSSQIIPISETQMTNLTQGANPVPLSDLARSQNQGSARFHDLFINLLDTESSVGLRLSRGVLRLPVEINEENGSLMSNVTKKELIKLDGVDLKINPKKSRMLLDSIILNDSAPIPIKCGVLKLFLSLALSSSKKKFMKNWKSDELPEKLKISSILEKAKISRSPEFLVLSLALLEVLLSFNPNQLVSSLEHVKKPPRVYSDSQCGSIIISLELLKVEAETFEDLDLNSRTYPIIQDLFNKCFTLLKNMQS
ncbi:very large membrane [Cryptosporidium sp. chipmunk genotype I]|uniref:very large membrane n=1 Tax=Cryptosporidium sp. chipmunk genotype I TaxID=1280935 RepID=UPI00351A0D51|nr:very large membrane [Cryptosporidium sp. chipmunk genotype I]